MDRITPPAGAVEIISRLRGGGYEAYIVGGFVGDSLRGREPKDWDITTSARPEAVTELFADRTVVPTGIKHGTVTVLEADGAYEVTTFRIDGQYLDHRRPRSVTFSTSIADDLARRDFTSNAMAYDILAGRLVDPFGGLEDIRARRIVCVRDPEERLSEDALRILRGMRFASELGFEIEERTARAIHERAPDLLKIAAERITSELTKLLLGQDCTRVLCEYKDVIALIIPELAPCIGFDQRSRWHCYDVYDHNAHAVGYYRGGDAVTKYALLLHDMGKPRCFTLDEKGGHFIGHGAVGAELAGAALARLRLPAETCRRIRELVRYHDINVPPTKKGVRRWVSRLGQEQFSRYLEVHRADILAHSETAISAHWDQDSALREIFEELLAEEGAMSLQKLDVRGDDLISAGVPRGPEVGKLLGELLDLVIDEKLPNRRQALLEYVNKKLRER